MKSLSLKDKIIYIILFALQFEMFGFGGVSVFQVVILPLSLIYLMMFNVHHVIKYVRPLLILLLWIVIWNIILGDIHGFINKLLCIPFLLAVFDYFNSIEKSVRFDRIFLLNPILSIMGIFGGFANFAELRFSGIYSDANFACIYTLWSFCGKLTFFSEQNKYWKSIYIILLAADVTIVFMTQSRGGLLTLLAICLLYTYFHVRNKKQLIILCSILGILGYVLVDFISTLDYWMGDNNIVTAALARFSQKELEGGGGRDDLWTDAFTYMMNNDGIFFPVGYRNYNAIIKFFTHNSFIDMSLDTGLLFSISFLTNLIIGVALSIFRYSNRIKLNINYITMYLLFLTGFVSYFFLSAFDDKSFFFTIGLGIFLLKKTKTLKTII